jgi:hypothetical protein
MRPNPFQYLVPVHPQGFVARWPLIKSIALDLTLEGGNSHAIIAGRRCGKSSAIVAIAYQLQQSSANAAGDWETLPITFDFKSGEFATVGEVLARLLHETVRRVDVNARRRPADAWPSPINLDAPWFRTLIESQDINLQEFEDGIDYIARQIDTSGHHARLVFLIDEIDDALDKPWTESLFNQLRALVYSGDLKSQIRLVFAGSHRFLAQVSKRGSPLWNILKLHYLDPFDEQGFGELVSRAPEISQDITSIIWQKSGGHPFIAQYLLHHLWDDDCAFSNASLVKLHNLCGKFLSEQVQDIEGWAQGVDIAGFHAYSVLIATADWVEEQTILRTINNPDLNLKRGLLALCYHGLAIHDDGWAHYRCAGDIFKSWFTNSGAAFLASRKVAEPVINQIVQVSGGTVVFGGNAQVQQDQIVHAERIAQMTYQEKVIKIGNNNTISAPVVIADSIQNSFNVLKDVPSDDVRSLLEELLTSVTELSKKVPAEKSADAESMARDVETLVKEASSSKPRRQWYEVSLDGLKQAAINIGDLADPIMGIVSKLFPLLLPAT